MRIKFAFFHGFSHVETNYFLRLHLKHIFIFRRCVEKQSGRVKQDLEKAPPLQSPSPQVLGALREFNAAYDEMEEWFALLEEYQRTEFDEL